jgi:hypothetical protein
LAETYLHLKNILRRTAAALFVYFAYLTAKFYPLPVREAKNFLSPPVEIVGDKSDLFVNLIPGIKFYPR